MTYVYHATFNLSAKHCIHAIMLISFCLSRRYFEQNDLADQPEWTVVAHLQDIKEEICCKPSCWCSIQTAGSTVKQQGTYGLFANQVQSEEGSKHFQERNSAHNHVGVCGSSVHVAMKVEDRTRGTASWTHNLYYFKQLSNLVTWMDLCWFNWTEAKAVWWLLCLIESGTFSLWI